MAWALTVTLVGSAGKGVNLNYALTGPDYATAAINRTNILTALAAVSEATISKHRLSEVTDVTDTLPLGVDVAIVGTMSGKIEGTNKGVVVSFPAPLDAVRLGTSGDDYNELNLAGGEPCRDYWALFGPSGQATVSDGEETSVSGPRASQIISKASRQP